MKYLITGGMGFVGSHLYERLVAEGADVGIFSNYTEPSYFDFTLPGECRITGDICNYNEVLRAMDGKDVVFHLAGVLGTDYLIGHPKLAVETNILGMVNVLEAAKKTGTVVCNLSLLPEWLNLYMLTKNMAASLCEMYYKEFGVKTVTLRASHIYGARQKWKPVIKAIPNFILSALKNEPLMINGNGNQLMDLLYIDDAVEGLLKSVRNIGIDKTEFIYGKSIQFGSGIAQRVVDIAEKIRILCGSQSELKFRNMRPGEPDNSNSFTPVDVEDQYNLLGFTTKIDMEAGLSKTINWYRDYLK